MKNLLVINSSPNADQSATRSLTAEFALLELKVRYLVEVANTLLNKCLRAIR